MKRIERVDANGGMETSFGFSDIAADAKQQEVNKVFHSVAQKYDIMNDVMSMGMHRLWKDALINRLRPAKYTSWSLLDVAGGTADIGFRALKAAGGNTDIAITVLDINSSMLEVGRMRAQEKELEQYITFIEGDAQKLPFADNSFDAYSISFGIRNVPHINQALSEAYRVLKPGGHFLCLEFSQMKAPALKHLFERLYDLWSFSAIPNIGQALTGDKASYQYLVESIRKFPAQEDFKIMCERAGFANSQYRNLSAGIAAIHEGWKL